MNTIFCGDDSALVNLFHTNPLPASTYMPLSILLQISAPDLYIFGFLELQNNFFS